MKTMRLDNSQFAITSILYKLQKLAGLLLLLVCGKPSGPAKHWLVNVVHCCLVSCTTGNFRQRGLWSCHINNIVSQLRMVTLRNIQYVLWHHSYMNILHTDCSTIRLTDIPILWLCLQILVKALIYTIILASYLSLNYIRICKIIGWFPNTDMWWISWFLTNGW